MRAVRNSMHHADATIKMGVGQPGCEQYALELEPAWIEDGMPHHPDPYVGIALLVVVLWD